MCIDPETAVSDMIHSNPNIIAAAVIKGTQIIYTTDNWDISGDVDRFLSSWIGQNAQFIMISGVKYSILQMEAERLVAMSYKGGENIVAIKDDEYILIFHTSKMKLDESGGDLPFPYIFKPPTPPEDLGLSGQAQLKQPTPEEDLWDKPYCKNYGSIISEGQTICPACGKKVI